MRKGIAGGLCVALLVGCSGLDAQRPIGNAMKPPAGWTEIPMPVKVAVNPVLGIWMHGTSKENTGEFMTLLRFPSSKKSITDQIMEGSGSKDGEIVSQEPVKLCNGASGVHMKLKTTQKSGTSSKKDLDMDVVAGQGKNESLIAIYARPMGSTPDPAALASIEHLCPILDAKGT